MSEAPKIVEVAAAVILRREGREFLLACRPEGKVYAGYWEFPGGKVEPGESVHQALVRELQEELGITVTIAHPWLVRRFTYPHATVNLNFYRVHQWQGEIHPKEHSGFSWIGVNEAPDVAPILPANAPILKGISLPATMAITHAEAHGVEAELARLEHALTRGLRLVQIRDKALAPEQRRHFAQAACEKIRAAGAIALINGDADLAQALEAGLHLSSQQLAEAPHRPEGFHWVGASCHTRAELEKAMALELDYAVVGPTLATPTHPEAQGLGWDSLQDLIQGASIPVFAIGGMQPALLELAMARGCHGFALMRGWS